MYNCVKIMIFDYLDYDYKSCNINIIIVKHIT